MRIHVGSKNGKYRKWIKWSVIAMLVLTVEFFLLILMHPLLAQTVLPSIEHEGVELYEDGTYLSFRKGDVFHALISEYAFTDQGEVVSFVYHDSALRDSWKSPTFPDAFILELDMGEHYAAAVAELEARDAWNYNKKGDPHFGHQYDAGESGDGDYLFVTFFPETGRAVFALITDTDCSGSAQMILDHYFSIPGMPPPRKSELEWYHILF